MSARRTYPGPGDGAATLRGWLAATSNLLLGGMRGALERVRAAAEATGNPVHRDDGDGVAHSTAHTTEPPRAGAAA